MRRRKLWAGILLGAGLFLSLNSENVLAEEGQKNAGEAVEIGEVPTPEVNKEIESDTKPETAVEKGLDTTSEIIAEPESVAKDEAEIGKITKPEVAAASEITKKMETGTEPETTAEQSMDTEPETVVEKKTAEVLKSENPANVRNDIEGEMNPEQKMSSDDEQESDDADVLDTGCEGKSESEAKQDAGQDLTDETGKISAFDTQTELEEKSASDTQPGLEEKSASDAQTESDEKFASDTQTGSEEKSASDTQTKLDVKDNHTTDEEKEAPAEEKSDVPDTENAEKTEGTDEAQPSDINEKLKWYAEHPPKDSCAQVSINERAQSKMIYIEHEECFDTGDVSAEKHIPSIIVHDASGLEIAIYQVEGTGRWSKKAAFIYCNMDSKDGETSATAFMQEGGDNIPENVLAYLPSGGYVTVLEVIDETWVYVENGEIRGFMKIKDLTEKRPVTSYATRKDAIYMTDESQSSDEKAIFPISFIEPSKNEALLYIHTTAEDLDAFKGFVESVFPMQNVSEQPTEETLEQSEEYEEEIINGQCKGYSQEELELIWAITAQEDDTSYEGALAVISSAMNRAGQNYGGYGTSVLAQYTAPGQYCYSPEISDPSYWMVRLHGNVPDYVKNAVSDCLEGGLVSHSYLNFRSSNRTGSYVQIGGNWYF